MPCMLGVVAILHGFTSCTYEPPRGSLLPTSSFASSPATAVGSGFEASSCSQTDELQSIIAAYIYYGYECIGAGLSCTAASINIAHHVSNTIQDN
eukprot:scaffold635605_cov39-Prasinocladus_malaysianus.AAC.1